MAEFPAAGPARQPSPAFAWELCGGTGELHPARRAFDAWLTAHEVDPEHRGDLSIVLSELAANAIAAGDEDGRGPISIRAWRDGADVVLEVENAVEDDTLGVALQDQTDGLRGTGRGLLIVAAYASSVDVIPADVDSGLTVRCRTLAVS